MTASPLYRDFVSSAEIDAQYNVGATLADAGTYLRGYADRSREARARLRCKLDIAYGPTLDETLDIFPADRPGAPVFVFIHGNTSSAFDAHVTVDRSTFSPSTCLHCRLKISCSSCCRTK